MASFNKVILAGNLTRDPELRYTPKGTAIARIGLACNRNWKSETGEMKEEVTFVDVDAFGKTAETIGQYLKKGRPILIEGRLALRNLGRQADQTEEKQTRGRAGKLSISGLRRRPRRRRSRRSSGFASRRQRLRRPRPKAAKPTAPRKETTFPFDFHAPIFTSPVTRHMSLL